MPAATPKGAARGGRRRVVVVMGGVWRCWRRAGGTALDDSRQRLWATQRAAPSLACARSQLCPGQPCTTQASLARLVILAAAKKDASMYEQEDETARVWRKDRRQFLGRCPHPESALRIPHSLNHAPSTQRQSSHGRGSQNCARRGSAR